MFAGRKKKIETPDTSVVVVAAGSASRMGGMDKQLVLLGGVPVLIHTLQRIGSCPSVREIILVTREQSIPVFASDGCGFWTAKNTHHCYRRPDAAAVGAERFSGNQRAKPVCRHS